MQKINWGIIGVGDVAEVKSGPGFQKASNSDLAAVMRRQGDKAKDYATRHQVPKWYDDAEALLNDPDVNAIYIATPPKYHKAYALRAIEVGKPVYLEKPVTLNAQECKEIIKASKNYNVKITAAHYRRALPKFSKIKQIIDGGTLGAIKAILLQLSLPADNNMIAQTEENWRLNPDISGGGLFHDLAPHQLDILTWIFGKPENIYGKSINQSNLYQAPDLVNLQSVFGADMFFSGTWAFTVHPAGKEDRCKVLGAKGSLTFSFFSQEDIVLETDDGTQTFGFENPAHIQQPMIEKVVSYFRGESDNPCSMEEAMVTMEMIDAVS